jgi:iron complex outermembrane receptor protein
MKTQARLGRARHRQGGSSRHVPLIVFVTSLVLLSSGVSRATDTGTDASVDDDKPAPDSVTDGGSSLAEVTITGGKDQPTSLQTLHDLPSSISVLTGADLQLQDAVDMGGITRRAANVKWNPGNSREFSFSIRGLGYQSNTEAEDPSVGVNVDGVAYAYNPLSSFDFTDVNNVEVLRGPQGTAGGKNANLGVINVTTNIPTFTPETSYSVAYGERNSIIGWGVFGGPLIDGLLAGRFTLSADKEGGYIENLYNPSETYGNRDRLSGRVQFLLTPGATFHALVRLDLEPTGGEFYNGMTIYTPTPTFYANGKPNPLTTDASTRLARSWFTQQGSYTYSGDYLYGAGQNAVDNNSQRPLITRSQGASTELDWNLGQFTLTSLSAYKDYHFFASNDEGTPFDVTTASGGGVDYRQTTEELRLNSPVGAAVDYRTGVFLLDSGTQGPVSVSKNGWGSDAGAWFANAGQYATLDVDDSGRSLLENSLDDMRKTGYEYDQKKTAALYGQADWHLFDPLTLTTGLRLSYEDRRTINNALLTAYGYGAALNPVAVNNVQLGGFGSNATTGQLLATDTAQQLALANSVAQEFFNVANYSALSASQLKQVANAKALRQTQIGVLWNNVQAQPFSKVQPGFVFSPSYKINSDVTSYVSVQHGEKAGISQTTNGVSNLTQPEKSTAYEIGTKTLLLDRTLTLNADLYLNNIRNYQQAVQVFDAYTTALNHDGTSYYTSATGNAPKVQAKGFEVDATYDGIPHTSIRFSGAYNDAVYKDFPNAGQPVEDANQASPYRNATGMTLPGAAKVTFDVDVSYRRPLFAEKDFFFSFDTAFTSAYNSDVTGLSSYAWIPAHSTTDFSIGLGRSDRHFDVSLLIKNLFDDQSHLATTWDSYTPAPPRWIGVMLNGTL